MCEMRVSRAQCVRVESPAVTVTRSYTLAARSYALLHTSITLSSSDSQTTSLYIVCNMCNRIAHLDLIFVAQL